MGLLLEKLRCLTLESAYFLTITLFFLFQDVFILSSLISMKTNYVLKLIFLLLFSISSFASSTLNITINQEKHSLVAPEGAHYQWFKNDQVLMGEAGKELVVTEAGEYKVEIMDEKGEVSAPTITVAVNAMGAIIKIYTIGDSTVQDYNAGYYPRKGWSRLLCRS